MQPLPPHLRKLINRALVGVIRRRREGLKLKLEAFAKKCRMSRQMIG